MKQASAKLMLAALLGAASLQASVIYDSTTTMNGIGGVTTQTGRLSRNGVPQDWANDEAFPGVINTGTTYSYTEVIVPVGVFSFIQVDIDNFVTGTQTFFSAYDTSYAPDSAGSPNFGFDTHWLGDAGFSGDPIPGDPQFFNVVIGTGHNLVVVVSTTSTASGGLNDQFHLTVEGFLDSSFDDVPEPASIFLGGSALAVLGWMRRFRRR